MLVLRKKHSKGLLSQPLKVFVTSQRQRNRQAVGRISGRYKGSRLYSLYILKDAALCKKCNR